MVKKMTNSMITKNIIIIIIVINNIIIILNIINKNIIIRIDKSFIWNYKSINDIYKSFV